MDKRNLLTKKNLKSSPVGVENPIQESNYQSLIYPNPARERITIQLENEPATNQVVLFDLNGRMHDVTVTWMDTRVLELDLANLRPGLYYVRIDMGASYRMLRFVKQ